MTEYYSTAEAAAMLGISTKTLRRRVHARLTAGDVPCMVTDGGWFKFTSEQVDALRPRPYTRQTPEEQVGA